MSDGEGAIGKIIPNLMALGIEVDISAAAMLPELSGGFRWSKNVAGHTFAVDIPSH